jgi:hypothetical protein
MSNRLAGRSGGEAGRADEGDGISLCYRLVVSGYPSGGRMAERTKATVLKTVGTVR